MITPHYSFTAAWIWGPGDPAPRNIVRQFRAGVDLADPAGCVLRIAADTRYRLWVNGTWIGRGSRQSMPWLTFFDSWDVSAALRTGHNVVAIDVYHLGTIHQSQPGLLAELAAGDGRIICATGRDAWQTRPDPAWNHPGAEIAGNQRGRFQELIDGRYEDVDWQQSWNGASWTPAETILGRLPWTLVAPRCAKAPVEIACAPPQLVGVEECLALDRLHPHDLSVRLSQAGRPLQRAKVAGAETLAQGGEARLACAYPLNRDDTADIHEPCLLFDAGRVVTAFVELDVTAPVGATVSLGFAERLVDGHFNNAIECSFASG